MHVILLGLLTDIPVGWKTALTGRPELNHKVIPPKITAV